MGKKQEISTEQDFDVFKILYTSSCKEAGIGLQNKAAALHALIQKLSENPDDDMHYTGSRSSLKMHFQITKTGQTLPSK